VAGCDIKLRCFPDEHPVLNLSFIFL
jgi:hypothetical protein